jgi:hypothetical protein
MKLLSFLIVLASFTACNNSSTSILEQDSPIGFMPSIKEGRLLTQEEADKILPTAFDIDGDGAIATNSYWLTAQQFPVSTNLRSSIRANSTIGSGKTILFFTRLNNQWINFTSDLRLALENEGYTVLVQNDDQPLQDLSNVDVLAIIGCLGTPFATYNDRPLSFQDRTKIQNFISSGKGFFFSGDWTYSELSKYNEIAGMFGATMSLQDIDYIPIYQNGYVTTYFLPYTWHAYVFDFVNFYQTSPSQPILKRAPLYGYSSFSNADHDIFKNVNEVLLLGSSYMTPKNLQIEAGVKTHPTTSRPRDYPITPEGYPLVVAKNYGSGRIVLSCDSNCFANDGFAKSDLAGTDNRVFAINVFNWLARTSSEESQPVIKVIGLDFLSGSGLDNRNRLYDRKETYKSGAVGDKFLEPTQWAGGIDSATGEITESNNWPVSYVRNDAVSLNGNSSKIKLSVKVDDFKATTNPGSIEVEAVATIYGENSFQQTITFPVTTFNPTAWPTIFELESTNALPDFVGIFNLEINWTFKKDGQVLSNQRTPKTGDFIKVYTTWEKPILSGLFRVGASTSGGNFYAEEIPTLYLEIVDFSSRFINGFDSAKTKDEVLAQNLDKIYNHLGANGYKYSVDEITASTRRGIDRILSEPTKDGWCLEWSHFFKAINESQGANIKDVIGYLNPGFPNGALIADGTKYVAIGSIHSTDLVPPDPGNLWWPFLNHRYSVNEIDNSFDATFGELDSNYVGYFEKVFDYLDTSTNQPDPTSLNYVLFSFEE